MIELTCPQCQTKLPVAEEKIGKTLFVCPSCSFPLDAPESRTHSGSACHGRRLRGLCTVGCAVDSGAATDARAETGPDGADRSHLDRCAPLRPIKVPASAPRMNAVPPPPPVAPNASASQHKWLIGGGVVACAAVLAGVLFFATRPKTSPSPEQASSETPKMSLLDVLREAMICKARTRIPVPRQHSSWARRCGRERCGAGAARCAQRRQ